MESYKYLAAVYDSLMYDVDYKTWAQYIINSLSEYGEHKRVLEYACGTGNLSEYFAEKYDLVCVDISPQMLNSAKEKLQKMAKKAVFVCENMEDFGEENMADAALCCMDGVNYLTEGTDKFFENAYKNLKKGGALAFDISSYNKLTKILGNEFFYDDEEDVTYLWQNYLEGNIVDMQLCIFVKEGKLYRRFDESHTQRAYKKEEIIKSLEKAGFGNIKCQTFLENSKGKDTDERLQFFAVKE